MQNPCVTCACKRGCTTDTGGEAAKSQMQGPEHMCSYITCAHGKSARSSTITASCSKAFQNFDTHAHPARYDVTFPRILRRHSCSRRSTLCKNANMPTNVHVQPRTQRCHARCPAEACRVCCHAGRWECAKSRCMSTGAYHAVRWSLHTQGNSGDALSFPRQDSLKNQGSKKKNVNTAHVRYISKAYTRTELDSGRVGGFEVHIAWAQSAPATERLVRRG